MWYGIAFIISHNMVSLGIYYVINITKMLRVVEF